MVRFVGMEGTETKGDGVVCSGGRGTGRSVVNETGATIARETVKKLVEEHCVRIVAYDDGGVHKHQLGVELKHTDRRPCPQFGALLVERHISITSSLSSHPQPRLPEMANRPNSGKFSTGRGKGICQAPVTPTNVLTSTVVKE